jgi:uncharacterized membrane protein YjfL (UPF0719 family)
MKKINLGFAATTIALVATAAFAQGEAAPAANAAAKTGMDGAIAIVLALVMAIVSLLITLWLAMKAVSRAISMFDKTTEGIDEWAELRKGNVAVGLLMGAVILSVANVTKGSIIGLTDQLTNPSLTLTFALQIVVGVLNLLVGLWISTNVISMTLKVLDKSTKDVEEIKEIGKGNVAVALMVTGVLLGVSTIVEAGISKLSGIVRIESIAKIFGWNNN